MKCPICKYEHGYDIDKGKIEGEYGEFFYLSNDVQLIRDFAGFKGSLSLKADIYGCPKCRKLFLTGDF